MSKLHFEIADPETHAGLVREWLDQPHVAPWWSSERTLETRAYLERQRDTSHLVPWVVSHEGKPFAYVETYRAAEDALADAYPLTDRDRGWHVLVGPPEVVGSGIPLLLGRAVLARLLVEPGVERVVCEPDERNTRMLRFCEKLGYSRLATLELSDKRAALMACPKEVFVQRWPDDLRTLVS